MPRPIAGHPLPAGWNHAPKPADPNEIFAVDVPGGIARNPGELVTNNRLFGGQLFNRRGWIGFDERAWSRIEHDRFRERFVNRPAGQHFDLGRLRRIVLRLRARRLPTEDRRNRGRDRDDSTTPP